MHRIQRRHHIWEEETADNRIVSSVADIATHKLHIACAKMNDLEAGGGMPKAQRAIVS